MASPEDRGQHHHKNCPNYKTKKHAYLFYLEEAVDAYIPAPEKLEHIINADNMDVGQEHDILFRRVDMTDEEYDKMPQL